MDVGNSGGLLPLVRRLGASEADDDSLLRRFSAGDEAAFAALVERHGPMVLGVCRRVLRDEQDAEDAFQAAFLVLARKASARPSSLGGWLHGVAFRVACRARADAARRRRHERQAPVPPASNLDPSAEADRHDRQAILDEELSRLPQAYRSAVVLCDLRGLSHERAARESGCPVGSVSWRLRRGRELLRGRLARRGIDLAALLPGATSLGGASAVPAGLAALATAVKTNPSEAVSALADGAAGALGLARWKVALAGLLVLLAGGLLLGGGRTTPPARFVAADVGHEEVELKVDRSGDFLGDPLPPGAVARMGTTRLKQPGLRPFDWIRSLFTPDGEAILSFGAVPEMILWEVRTGKEIRTYRGHKGPVEHAAISPDGQTIASSGGVWANDHGVRLWDLKTGKELRRFDRAKDDHVFRVLFSPDSKYLLVGGMESLFVWDLKAQREATLFEGQKQKPRDGSGFHSFAFSPDGKTFVSFWDNKLIDWDATRWARRQEMDFYEGRDPQFSPDGKMLFVTEGVRPKGKLVYDTATWKETKPPAEVRAGWDLGRDGLVGFAPATKGGTLYQVNEIGAKVLRDATGKEVVRFTYLRPDGVTPMSYSRDGKYAAGSSDDNDLRLWSMETGKELHRYQDTRHVGGVTAVAFALGGKTVVTAGYDGTVRFWDAGTGKPGKRLPQNKAHVRTIAVSPDGKVLATSYQDEEDATIHLWSVTTGKAIRSIGEGGGARLISFAPDGKTVAASPWGQKEMVFYDVATGKRTGETGGKGWVSAFAYSADGKLMALGHGDHPERIVLHDGKGTRTIAEPHRNMIFELAFSSDASLLVSSGDETARVWQTATGKLLHVLSPDKGEVKALALSPDGRLIATASARENVVRLWSPATGKLLGVLDGHRDPVEALAFASDGRRLASGSQDGTAVVWDVAVVK